MEYLNSNKDMSVKLNSILTFDTIFNSKNGEILKLCNSGDIYVRGKLIENDKEVVEALRDFLKSNTRDQFFKNDEDYQRTWKDNIAMAFKDEMERSGIHSPNEDNHSILVTREQLHKIANSAADNFIKQLLK